MDALITAENLVKLYQMGDETVRALDGVSFSIPRGAYCAIVGPSGERGVQRVRVEGVRRHAVGEGRRGHDRDPLTAEAGGHVGRRRAVERPAGP